MEELKWVPRKDISGFAYANTIKGMPSFTVDTVKNNGKEVTLTLVRYTKLNLNNLGEWTIIIDGSSRSVDTLNLLKNLDVYFHYSIVQKLEHVIRNNRIFTN